MENRIIASTYQVIREIGSGGGGVVYLATHLRLGKFVVLKADKRGLTQKPEALRREVDALKNLSHTYIPQVYDFIEENGVVYTVMDYVEGESLDKPLKRGSAFPQATVVQWACQLLEALNYMHTRPPHGILHGDTALRRTDSFGSGKRQRRLPARQTDARQRQFSRMSR